MEIQKGINDYWKMQLVFDFLNFWKFMPPRISPLSDKVLCNGFYTHTEHHAFMPPFKTGIAKQT